MYVSLLCTYLGVEVHLLRSLADTRCVRHFLTSDTKPGAASYKCKHAKQVTTAHVSGKVTIGHIAWSLSHIAEVACVI